MATMYFRDLDGDSDSDLTNPNNWFFSDDDSLPAARVPNSGDDVKMLSGHGNGGVGIGNVTGNSIESNEFEFSGPCELSAAISIEISGNSSGVDMGMILSAPHIQIKDRDNFYADHASAVINCHHLDYEDSFYNDIDIRLLSGSDSATVEFIGNSLMTNLTLGAGVTVFACGQLMADGVYGAGKLLCFGNFAPWINGYYPISIEAQTALYGNSLNTYVESIMTNFSGGGSFNAKSASGINGSSILGLL